MQIETMPGQHIRDVLANAVQRADESEDAVGFIFNDVRFTVEPGEGYTSAVAWWQAATGIPVLTREEESEQARKGLAEMEARYERDRAAAGAATEQEMREADVPWLKDAVELSAYIEGLVDRPHDYGTCVYAMSMAAVAAQQYVASRLGVSGFQASCADLDILRRMRRLEHGFQIVDYGQLLYPQYWNDETRPIFDAEVARRPEYWAEQADKLLDDQDEDASRAVREHWLTIALTTPRKSVAEQAAATDVPS